MIETSMKKILVLVFLFSAIAYSQQASYSPFSINHTKTVEVSSQLQNTVDDILILNLNSTAISELLSRKSNSIRLQFPFEENRTISLSLNKFDVLTDDVKFIASNGTTRIEHSLKDKLVFYRGFVPELNNALVTFTFGENFVAGMLSTASDDFVLARMSDSPTEQYIFYQSSKIKVNREFKCGTEEMEIPSRIQEIQRSISRNAIDYSSANLLRANIAIETDYETYLRYGTVAATTQYIVSLMAVASSLYLRDVNVQLYITYMNFWTTINDPYTGTTSNALLNQFRAYWNSNFQSVPRTLAHFISTRGGNLGGVAWLTVLCANLSSGYGYAFSNINGVFNQLPTYSWDAMVVAHETGHNFGSPHTHNCGWSGGPIDSCYATEGGCYTGPAIPRVGTIMSYCHLNGSIALNFGPLPSNLIRTNAENASCFNNITGFIVGTPNGGEILRSGTGTPALIIWGTPFVGNVNVDYSINNGSTWQNIQSNVLSTNRNIQWTLPYIPTTIQAKVRVYETGNPTNGDQSDSMFQIRPSILPVTLLNPPQLARYGVNPGDTTTLKFNWTKGGTLPEFKYTWTLERTDLLNSVSTLSDNNGSDSVKSIRLGTVDSLMTAWGVVVGDSLRCRWKIRTNTLLDSSSTTIRIITFIRGVIGIINITAEIPKSFSLTQNYPNPFNPETKIRFGLPKSSFIKITVYDATGRVVSVLVNEKLNAGIFETDFNAANFSSGVYFYKMETDPELSSGFTDIKKMVIIK